MTKVQKKTLILPSLLFLNFLSSYSFVFKVLIIFLLILEQNGNQFEHLDQDSVSSADQISDCIVPSPLIDIPGSILGLGSLVEVTTAESGKSLHGVIRWIGQKHQDQEQKMPNGYAAGNELVVGVELDEPCSERGLRLTDGVYNGQRCFRCPDRRAIFVSPKQCTKDRRFHDDVASKSPTVRSNTPSEGKAFGADCPIIEGSVGALSEFQRILKRYFSINLIYF